MSFETIYEIAKTKNAEALKAELVSNCIDEFKVGTTDSAVFQLAAESDLDSVHFLLNFGASIKQAAKGAGYGGHKLYAEELISNNGINIHWVAEGAARGGHQDYAEELRARGASTDNIARGAAQGGYQDYAESFLKLSLSNLAAVSEGAALGGHLAYAEELRKLIMGIRDPLTRGGASTNAIAKNAAIGGYFSYANELIKLGGNILSWVAEGAALGGHKNYCEELMQRKFSYESFNDTIITCSANITSIARAAAEGGHQAHAEELISRGASMDLVAWGAAGSDHDAFANKLLQNGASIDEVSNGLLQKFFRSDTNYTNYQIKCLSFYSPENITRILEKINQVLEIHRSRFADFHSSRPPLTIDETVGPKAIAISKLMHADNLNFSEAFGRIDAKSPSPERFKFFAATQENAAATENETKENTLTR